MKSGIFILLLFILNACQFSKDVRLEQALNFAGDNRKELEKVLEHYKNEPEKLEAARFLIRNMPHWYSYEGWQLDSVKQVLASGNISKEATEQWRHTSFYSLPKVYDSHIITAGYLIENIDMAFDVWKKYPWNKTLGFDDFCELILPYRIADEPISAWRKLYHDRYAPALDSTYHGNDVVEACRIVDKKLKETGYSYNTDFSIPHLNGDFLFYHRIGYCREVCDLTVYAMRACGIPVATEYFVYAPDYQHYHSWNTLRDTTGLFIQFDFNEFEATRDKRMTDGRKKGKVYRYCFGKQQKDFPDVEGNSKIPPLLRNQYVKDVTANYFGKNEVTVPLQSKKGKYVYLGIFSPEGWIPVGMALREDNRVTFHNLESGIIYMPLYSDGKRHTPAGYPFIYKDGKTELLKPDTQNMEEAVLKRKMSIKPTISEWLYRGIIGLKIEASDNPSFVNADLLYLFTDTLRTNYYELTPLKTGKRYRYVRIVPPPNKRMELAEFSIYQDTLCQKRVSLHRINDIEPLAALDNITDGNILSYFQAKDTATYVAYDLKEATMVNKITFSPRNDDNYIWPGDCYELFYQDGIDGWKSLGMQTATNRALKYHIPQNALFWLRDRTKGREEQIFIYKNGNQIFTIDL